MWESACVSLPSRGAWRPQYPCLFRQHLPAEGLTCQRQSGLKASQCQVQKESKLGPVQSFLNLKMCFSDKILPKTSASGANIGELVPAGSERLGRVEVVPDLVRPFSHFATPQPKAEKPPAAPHQHLSRGTGWRDGAGLERRPAVSLFSCPWLPAGTRFRKGNTPEK